MKYENRLQEHNITQGNLIGGAIFFRGHCLDYVEKLQTIAIYCWNNLDRN